MRKVVIVVAVLAFLAALHISISKSLKKRNTTSQVLTDTAPGRVFADWQNAFNAGDAAAYERFIAERTAPGSAGERNFAQVTADDMNLRRNVGGGFDVHSVLRTTKNEISVLAREHSGLGYTAITLGVEPESQKITRMEFRDTPAPPDAVAQRMDEAALAKDVQQLVAKLAENDGFSGVVMIAKGDAPLLTAVHGMADRERNRAITADTRFNLGSMDKMFTAVAIAQLVQEGKLRYTDTLAQVLPDYPRKEIAGAITVHQLLTHTSGMGDIFGPEFEKKKQELRELRDYLPLFADRQLRFLPGEKFSYSNAGYIVLGLMVERLSGIKYADYVRQRIFEPAGMTSTGPITTAELASAPNVALGYTLQPPPEAVGPPSNTRRANTELLPVVGTSAGGGYSTAADLVRFAQALRANKLVNATQVQTLLTPHIDSPGGGKYGYGFGIEEAAGKKVVGHNGGYAGTNTELHIYWESPYTVVVLSNFDPPRASQVAEYIQQRIQP